MARPKRKTANTVELPSRGSKRHASPTHQEPEAKRRKNPKRACKEPVKKSDKQCPVSLPKKRRDEPKVEDPSTNAHPAATFKTPKNPQATFEGLPAELRLMIYEFASQSTMIHVHMLSQDVPEFTNKRINFYWTPCRGTNPKSPLLCANPKWSGMCKEEDRCTHNLMTPPEPRGFWALAASNKAIRREAKLPCLRNTVISIGSLELGLWLGHLSIYAPSHIEQIRRITIVGPEIFEVNNYAMEILQKGFPNLEGIGYQCQSPLHDWVGELRGGRWSFSNHAWKRWASLDWTGLFDSSVDVVFEAILFRRRRDLLLVESEKSEDMTAVRVFGHGTKDVCGLKTLGAMVLAWETETVKCSPLPEPKRNARWRAWW